MEAPYDREVNDERVVIRRYIGPDASVQDGDVRGVKAVINRYAEQEIVIRPTWLDSVSLRAIFQSGSLQESAEVVVPGGGVEIADQNQRQG